MAEPTHAAGLLTLGNARSGQAVAKNTSEDSRRAPEAAAEELVRAAADADERAGRLWRLEWAQAFKRLSEVGGKRKRPDEAGKN
jgi:hypothetical protein